MTFDDECCDFVMVSIIGVRGDELVMGTKYRSGTKDASYNLT